MFNPPFQNVYLLECKNTHIHDSSYSPTFVYVNLDLTVFFVHFAFIFRLSFHQFFIVILFPVIS